jgi:hypothetical protein
MNASHDASLSMTSATLSMASTTWVRPTFTVLGRRWSAFRVCGVTGLLLGTCLAMWLAGESGLSRAIVGLLLAMGMVTFLALAMATKIITGRESLVYYHHEIAILATAAVLLALLRLPVLAYLDVTALGLGVFLACGRCGCLMVGCCHGRPHRWGVRYSDDHAAEGFPRCFVGVRLFPIQAVESTIVALIVVAGSLLIVRGWPAGTALSTYVITYATARIWLEEARGDRARPYWLRLSEAQWTSLVVIATTVLGEWQGRLPFSSWHIAMGAGAALSLIACAASRRPERDILASRHANEIAEIVTSPPAAADNPLLVRRTSLTVGVSRQSLGRLHDTQATEAAEATEAMLFSLSRSDRELTLREARALSRLIASLTSRSGKSQELVIGRHHVYHLIVQQPTNGGRT